MQVLPRQSLKLKPIAYAHSLTFSSLLQDYVQEVAAANTTPACKKPSVQFLTGSVAFSSGSLPVPEPVRAAQMVSQCLPLEVVRQ